MRGVGSLGRSQAFSPDEREGLEKPAAGSWRSSRPRTGFGYRDTLRTLGVQFQTTAVK